ncbi:MAG TPA: hypothetical protein VMT20_26845 [Terriglobia bacterium]|nr:hypothetical protein [Terriglobia bacterium]
MKTRIGCLPGVDPCLRGGDIVGLTGSTLAPSFPRRRESTSFAETAQQRTSELILGAPTSKEMFE